MNAIMMSRRWKRALLWAGIAAVPLSIGLSVTWNQLAAADPQPAVAPAPPKADPRADIHKRRIELPLKTAIAGSAVPPSTARNENPPDPPKATVNGTTLDVGKYKIEVPLKKAVAGTTAVAVPPKKASDAGKSFIEVPVKNAVAGATTGAPPKAADPVVNPDVAPGQVKWHATVEAAKTASAKSGKPLLVLHMLGRLDKQFC